MNMHILIACLINAGKHNFLLHVISRDSAAWVMQWMGMEHDFDPKVPGVVNTTNPTLNRIIKPTTIGVLKSIIVCSC